MNIMTKETRKVTYLLYMDDIKLFTPNDKKLADQLKLVNQYSDIRMEFGLDKCAKCTFVQGKTIKQTTSQSIKVQQYRN